MALTGKDVLALDITVRGGKKAREELAKTAAKTEEAARKTNAANKKTAASTKSATKSLRAMSVGILATTAVVGGMIVAIDRLAAKAQDLQNLSRAFDTLNKRVGIASGAMLDGMRRAATGFVTDAELMKQANNALILGLPVTAESMEELVEASIKLGRAMGVDATRSIESVITGIGRQSRLMLDNIGIIVSVEKANLKYAASLGVNVNTLTDADKKLAFYNETVEQAIKKSEGLVASTGSLSETFIILKTQTKNLTNEFLEYVGALGSVPEASKVLETLEVQLKKLQALQGGAFAPTDEAVDKLLQRVKSLREVVRMEEVIAQRAADKQAAIALDEEAIRLDRERIANLERELELRQQISNIGGPQLFSGGLDARGAGKKGGSGGLELQTGGLGPNLDFTQLDRTRELQQQLLDTKIEFAIQWSNTQFELETERLDASRQMELDNILNTKEDIDAINERFQLKQDLLEERHAAARVRIAKREAQNKIQLQQAASNAIFGVLGDVFGGHKAFAIAQSIIDTHLAVANVWATIPYPFNIAVAEKMRLLGNINTAAIAATSILGGGGGGGAGGGGGGGGGGGLSAGGQQSQTAPFSPVPIAPDRDVEIKVFIEGATIIDESVAEELARKVGQSFLQQASIAGLPTAGA